MCPHIGRDLYAPTGGAICGGGKRGLKRDPRQYSLDRRKCIAGRIERHHDRVAGEIDVPQECADIIA